ncbi:MAG: molecular chaperone HtpG [Bacteroidales bacterium]|nr:molecular chaperone HtpG [Bacteroidales bacterium]
MQTGKINVQTENIFPVIKKFLYSDHEIFLRELISNAVDATQKLKTLVSLGKADCELGDLTIDVKVNKDDKTIHVTDRGIGMTAEEVDRYINQIAFSGAEDFLAKYKGNDAANIIGHFGLGFYSSFMVANRVDILTKSYQKDAQAVKWSCDGSPDFTLEEIDKSDRGTEIVLHVEDDDLQEFVNEDKLVELLNKYCRFLPVPIRCGMKTEWRKKDDNLDNQDNNNNDNNEKKEEPKEEAVQVPRIINDTDPIWQKQPSSLTDEDYNKFYRELYPMSFEEPMFHIHLNVDYPFNLTGVLYFPKIKNQLDLKKNRVQLYCNQVFITDELEGIVPDFMNLLHGVIDSPDIPLNVSRSYLQSDNNVKKISTYISKKVAEKLEEMFKENREEFEKKWDDLSIFLEYGSLTDEKFYDKIKDFYLLKNTEGKYFTIEEYRNKVSALQTDKNGSIVMLYAANADDQHVYIANAKEKGYDVLLMTGFLDTHFINMLEQKLEKVRFTRVDANVVDKLIEKEEDAHVSKLSEDQQKQLKELFEKQVDAKLFTPEVDSLSETDLPVIVTQNEFMRRFKDMEKVSGQQGFYGGFDHYNLVINGNHPLATRILDEKDEAKRTQLVQQMVDLAMLSQNILTGEKLSEFVKRSYELL